MNRSRNKPVRLSAIAGLILFAFPLAKQANAAQIEAGSGVVINQVDFTYDGVSAQGLLSDGAGAEINVTGTGTFNITNQNQTGFWSKNSGHINLTGGGTISAVDAAGGAGNASIARAVGNNSQITVNNYQITVDSSTASNGRSVLVLDNASGANQISNTNINFTGNQKTTALSVTASKLTLTNNHVVANNARGGAMAIYSQNSVLSTVDVDGGYYESTNSTDSFNGSTLTGATIDLGGGSTLNLKNNAQVISNDTSAIHVRYGTLNAQDIKIQGGPSGISSATSGGNANLNNVEVSATQGSAILVNAQTYNGSPYLGLNAVNSSLSGNHGIRVEKVGQITGSIDNTSVDAVDTAISVDYMNAASGSGNITLTVKNGSELKATNVFDAQNGGSLTLTMDGSTATGSSHLIYSKDSTVNLNAAASTLTGDMEQAGTGTVNVALSDASSFKGATTNINQLSLTGDSVWEVSNNSSLTTLNNSAGTISFATPSSTFHTVNVAGNYTGGGNLILNAKLGHDGSPTDKLVVAGDTSGNTKVKVNNIGGAGAQTINGIEIIAVQGSSNGTFEQDGRIVAGAYDYFLDRGDAASGNKANNWYLSSKLNPDGSGGKTDDAIRPEAGSYLGLIEHNQNAFNHSFHDRQQLLDNQYQSAWGRLEYSKAKSKAGNDQLDNDTESTLIHFGADLLQQDKLHIGVMGGYAKGDIDTSSNLSGNYSSAKSDGYSVGVYGTWFDQAKDKSGLYVDTYAQYNWFENKVNGKGLAEESFNTDGYTISAEAGYGFALGKMGNMAWQVEPQVQLMYNSYNGKDHTEQNGARINSTDSDDFVSRIGVRFQGKSEMVEPFVTLNYWNHSQNAGISMNETQVDSNRARDIFEVKAGGQIHLNKNVDLFAQVSSSWGDHSTSVYGGNIGLKVKW